MRRFGLRIAAALLTFAVGIAAASLSFRKTVAVNSTAAPGGSLYFEEEQIAYWLYEESARHWMPPWIDEGYRITLVPNVSSPMIVRAGRVKDKYFLVTNRLHRGETTLDSYETESDHPVSERAWYELINEAVENSFWSQ